MSQVDLQPYAAAIKAKLTGLRIGGGVAPKSTDGRIVAPCSVLYMHTTVRAGDAVGASGDDASVRFQLTSVDLTDEGALAQDARVKALLHETSLTVDDRFTCRVKWDSSQPVRRDDDVSPPCFYVPSLYSLMSMSSPEES